MLGSIVWDYDSEAMWSQLIQIGMSNLEKAEALDLSNAVMISTPSDNTVQPRSIATDYFKAELAKKHGATWGPSARYRDSVTYPGKTFVVNETFDYIVTRRFVITIADVMTLGTFITAYLGLTISSPVLVAIGTVLGVATQASAYIFPTTVTEYTCVADWYKHTTCNGSGAYAVNDKMLVYTGYDSDSGSPRMLPEANGDYIYSISESYYYDHDAQVDDAYAEVS